MLQETNRIVVSKTEIAWSLSNLTSLITRLTAVSNESSSPRTKSVGIASTRVNLKARVSWTLQMSASEEEGESTRNRRERRRWCRVDLVCRAVLNKSAASIHPKSTNVRTTTNTTLPQNLESKISNPGDSRSGQRGNGEQR